MAYRPSVPTLLLISAIALTVRSPSAQDSTSASFAAVEGVVELRASTEAPWVPARIGTRADVSGLLRVRHGRAVLQFDDGSRYEARGPLLSSVESLRAQQQLERVLTALGPTETEQAAETASGRATMGGVPPREADVVAVRTVRTTQLSLAEEVTVAVMPFEINTPPGELDRLGQSVHKLLLGRLGEVAGVRFVERAQLAQIVKEMKLSMIGLVDPAKAAEAGRLAGAQNVIVGEIASFPPMVDLEARVVDTETGYIVGKPVHATGEGTREAFRIINDLAEALTEELYTAYKFSAPGPGAPRFDICYVLDSTGSMGEALQDLRAFVDHHLVTLNRRHPIPDIRIAVVDYKDRTDPYVVNKLDFVPYVQADDVLTYLNGVSASGGGDYPECVYTGLSVALRDLAWDLAPEVTRMVFLLADSPPHTMYADEPTMEEVVSLANERNVTIRILGFPRLNNAGARTYEELAAMTNGTFQRFGGRVVAERPVATEGERDLARLEAEGTRGAKGGVVTGDGDSGADHGAVGLADVLLMAVEEVVATE